MSYSYHARKSFHCYEKRRGRCTFTVPPSATAFDYAVTCWAADSTHDDVFEEIENETDRILDKCGDEVKSVRQSAHALLGDQILAAEMVIDKLSGHMGKLITFRRCLVEVRRDYQDPEEHQQWPSRLAPYRSVLWSVIEFLIERCDRRQDLDIFGDTKEICYFECQRHLEQAFLIDTFTPASTLPQTVAELRECFRRLREHCNNALWNEVRAWREDCSFLDCICRESGDLVKEASNHHRFSKARKRRMDNMREALTIRPFPKRAFVSDQVLARLPAWRRANQTRNLEKSPLGRFTNPCEYNPEDLVQ